MKKITQTTTRREKSGGFFWQPWGFPGCLGRIIAFLLIMMAIIFLLNLLHKCSGEDPYGDNHNSYDTPALDSLLNPNPRPDHPYDGPTDTIAEWPPYDPSDPDAWRRNNIPDPGENLPSPDKNYLPPVDSTEIGTDDGYRRIVTDRLNVILDSDAADETFRRWADEFKTLYPGSGYQVVYYDPNTKMLQIRVPSSQREAVMRNLPHQITDISFKIFPDGLLGPVEAPVPNDKVFRNKALSWYFDPIQAREAWEITEGDPKIKIAVVDSYFDLNHDEFKGDRVKAPYSVVRRNSNVAPPKGMSKTNTNFYHGSMVASLALGTKDNEAGTAGIAPKCTLIPVSVGHQATSMTVAAGILYAINKGADVINVSMGTSFNDSIKEIPVDIQVELSRQFSREEEDVWNYITGLAAKRNVTIVWAAGNETVFSSLDPSKRSDNAIRVGAVNKRLGKADFSNFGNLEQYDEHASTVSAPGVGMVGAMPYNSYNIGDGTSFSAPLVSGAVALMKSLDPTLTNQEIITILQQTGRKPSDGDPTIGPVIRIKDALKKVKDNFASYDDILKDHNKLVGLWQSVTLLRAVDSNGEPTGEMVRCYYEFPNSNSGKSIIYETGTMLDFVGSVTVHWTPTSLGWTSTRQRCASKNMVYQATTVKCKPDKNGLLLCDETSESGINLTYYIKKVKSRLKE